jgi:hypothetical protein
MEIKKKTNYFLNFQLNMYFYENIFFRNKSTWWKFGKKCLIAFKFFDRSRSKKFFILVET